jgi:hypothetical protein
MDRLAGALIVVAVVLAASALAGASLLSAARSPRAALAGVGLLAALAIIVAWPLLADLFPGTPAARIAAARTGDTIQVPLRGAVRVLAQASGADGALFTCHPRLAIGTGTDEVDLHRQQEAVRIGRRGVGQRCAIT